MTATYKDYFKLHFIVFLWGFTAIIGKIISIPSMEMVFYRTVLAAMGMGLVIMVRGGTFKIETPDLIKVLLTGSIVAIHWVAFFSSVKIANPSTSLVGFATCAFWAAILEPISQKKKIAWLEVCFGVLVFFGLAMIFASDFRYPFGLFLGVVSGFTAALFSVINAQFVRKISSHTITFYEMIGAFMTIGLFFPFYALSEYELQLTPTAFDWLMIALLAWVSSVYAYTLAIDLMRKMSVFVIQLALNLEPLYGIVLALLIFGEEEVMGVNFYIGTLIIVSGVIFYPIVKKRIKAR